MTLPACDRIIELAEKATPRERIGVEEYRDHGKRCYVVRASLAHTYAKDLEGFRTLAPKIALALNEAVEMITLVAPHDAGCEGFMDGYYRGCTCWKRTALDRINELLTNPQP